jgi:hypothetical protein
MKKKDSEFPRVAYNIEETLFIAILFAFLILLLVFANDISLYLGIEPPRIINTAP